MQVLATAGHVDHGKSTLVQALTGTNPDRWEAERRRGLTIDLGFAWTRLAGGGPAADGGADGGVDGGVDIAFVDVPGHQRFLANMLAGVGPVPAVMVVVAADGGWCRQSGEHLAALSALGVSHGLVAVTRSDLADPAQLAATTRQVSAQLRGTPLAGAPTVAVSARTGAGLADLRAALRTVAGLVPPPDPGARVRLWVDRAFTVDGTGTVVTGTLGAGTVAVGDALEVDGRTVRVRGLESLGVARSSVAGTARVAIALRGVERGALRRGDALLTPGAWRSTAALDVRLSGTACAAADLPAQLILHVGAAAVAARVRPLAPDLARLTLGRPLPVTAGDRALLRDPGRQSVAAGVLVLDADPPPLTRRGAAAARAAELAGATGAVVAVTEVARRGVAPRRDVELLGAGPAAEVRTVDGYALAEGTWAGWLEGVPRLVAAHADAHPLDTGAPREELRGALGIPTPAVLSALLRELPEIVQTAAGRLSVAGRTPALAPAAAAALQRLQAIWSTGAVAAPDAGEVAALGLGGAGLGALAAAGRLLRLPGDVLLAPDAAETALVALRQLPPAFTVSQARQALGASRRIVVPLLEHLDATRRTRKAADGTRTLLDPSGHRA